MALLNQGKLVGVLYLENQLAIGAFTSERSQVLNLLSIQAAIAIENANQVYEQEVRIAASGDDEVLVMVRDINEQKNAALCKRKQAEKASILEERNRMTREIHDTLAQSFTSIIVHLDAASQRIEIDPADAQSHLKAGRTLARSGLADARRSVEALRPQILGDLRSALDRLASQMFSHTSVQVICKAIGEPQTLPIEVEANCFGLRRTVDSESPWARHRNHCEGTNVMTQSPRSPSTPVSVPIRVLLSDDHPFMREGLAAVLDYKPDMTVVGQACNGHEAVELFRQHQPDVTLMDLRMPELSGVDAIATICAEFADARIIVLTTYDGDEDIYRGLRAGAKGYVLKDAKPNELLTAIRAVHNGQQYIPPAVGAKLAERMGSPELSDRELEVLRLMATGKSNLEISTALSITEGTVKFHMKNILSKLAVSDRTQAMIVALKRGIITL